MASHDRRRIGAVAAAFGIGLLALVPADVLAGQPAPAVGEPAGTPTRTEPPAPSAPAAGQPAAAAGQPDGARPPDDASGAGAAGGAGNEAAPQASAESAPGRGAADTAPPAAGAPESAASGEEESVASGAEETAASAAAGRPAAVNPAGQAAESPAAVNPAAPAAGQPAESAAGRTPAGGENAPEPRADGRTADVPDARDDEPPADAPEPRGITRGDLVRVGGSVTIERGERVRGDVVVILGGLDVEGEVTGDVVVVAGSARFGPRAVARGDVTVVGGSLQRASSAVLRGSVTEIGVGGVRGPADSGGWRFGWPRGRWFGSADLLGTVMRLFVLGLLACGFVLVARVPVERIARRALAEPLKAGLVGMLAQMLTVPAFVLGILGLLISIVGIPFLLLLPFAVMAVGLVMLVGFSGAVLGAGELARSRMGAPGSAAFASVWAGVALILLPSMAGETVGLAGGLFGGLGVLLVLAGFLVEYAAWTAGLGALILNRFSPLSPAPGALPPGGPPLPAAHVPPPPSAPPVDPAVAPAPAPPAPPPIPDTGAPDAGRGG